ncbi:hypothetical protein T09_5713 [Trichinella sp. T9]|nr:hypothetical protein T09_5713 [Trichinella sp. T9]
MRKKIIHMSSQSDGVGLIVMVVVFSKVWPSILDICKITFHEKHIYLINQFVSQVNPPSYSPSSATLLSYQLYNAH